MPTRLSWLAKIIRTFYSLLYHQFSWSYDLVAGVVSVGMWKDWVLSILPELSGPNILEIGHGPGHLQKELANRNKSVHGLDLSPQMGKIAYKRLKSLGKANTLVNGNVENLPYPSNHFNQIAATFPTEYLHSPNAIKEILRVLKPEGMWVVLPFARITGDSWLHKAAAQLFKLTGQIPKGDTAPMTNLIRKYESFGFIVSTKTRKMKNSEILLLICRKPIVQ